MPVVAPIIGSPQPSFSVFGGEFMRLGLGVVAAVAALIGSGVAARAEGPFYVSGSVGGYFRQSDDTMDEFHHSATPTINVPGTDKRGFDPGVIGNVAIGYRLISHVRVEAEFGYFSYTGSTLNPTAFASGYPELNGQTFRRTSGDRFSRYTGTANAFYDFSPIAGLFAPYVGAGVGASRDHQSVGTLRSSDGTSFQSSGGSSTQGLAMVEGGLSFPITRNLSLVPAYRYVHFFAGNEEVAHVVKVGLRYSF